MSRYTKLSNWYRPLENKQFQVSRDVPWEVGVKGSGLWVVVPRGYRFDVSIPFLFRFIFSPTDPRYLKAAALHDYLLDQNWPRVTAAGVFSQALRAHRVPFWQRFLMVLAVVIYKFI